jgi:hypothetical protein
MDARPDSRRAAALLKRAMAEVAADGMVEALAATLRAAWQAPVHRIVLLGLGSPTTSAPARYQLALGLLLASALNAQSAAACMHCLRSFLSGRLC